MRRPHAARNRQKRIRSNNPHRNCPAKLRTKRKRDTDKDKEKKKSKHGLHFYPAPPKPPAQKTANGDVRLRVWGRTRKTEGGPIFSMVGRLLDDGKAPKDGAFQDASRFPGGVGGAIYTFVAFLRFRFLAHSTRLDACRASFPDGWPGPPRRCSFFTPSLWLSRPTSACMRFGSRSPPPLFMGFRFLVRE